MGGFFSGEAPIVATSINLRLAKPDFYGQEILQVEVEIVHVPTGTSPGDVPAGETSVPHEAVVRGP